MESQGTVLNHPSQAQAPMQMLHQWQHQKQSVREGALYSLLMDALLSPSSRKLLRAVGLLAKLWHHIHPAWST